MVVKNILVIIISILVFSCKEKKIVKEQVKQFQLSDSMVKMIELDSVTKTYIDDAITLTGEVTFNENSVNKVYPRNSGQVIESKVTVGDKVVAGQVLATIKSADIAGNYADLNSANADIIIAKRQLENTESLYKSGISSEKELTEARQNYEKTLSAKNKIQSTLSINGGLQSNANGTFNIVAPISGYIVEKKVNPGNFIRSDMNDNLFTISDLKNVWVYANVFESDIAKVHEGYEVSVTTIAYPDKIIKGKIEKMNEVLDVTSKTLRVRIRLDNSDALLRPEMFAKVIVFNKGSKLIIAIPTKSIINLNAKTYVVTYISGKEMHINEIDIFKTVGERTYLNAGVNPGEKIIVKNQLLIFQELLNE